MGVVSVRVLRRTHERHQSTVGSDETTVGR